jgi:predicted DNA binding CopG/RHH family protein
MSLWNYFFYSFILVAKPKSGSIVSEKLMVVFSRCDSPIAPPLFEYSALAIGAKERQFMSAKIKYTDEPLGKTQVVADFLPSPSELAFREEGVKVTLALSKKSIEFFKSEATKHHTQYQRMIRRLLDSYVDTHAPTQGSSGMRQKRRAP